MTDFILGLRRQLSKRLFKAGRQKNRIVTEAGPATRRIDNCSFGNSFERAEQFATTRQRDHAPESRRSFSLRLSRKLPQQFFDIVLVACHFPAVTRGINSRRTVQRVDLQSRIVRHDKILSILRYAGRFQDRVLRKTAAGLFDFSNIRGIAEIGYLKTFSQDLGKLARLVRVARRE